MEKKCKICESTEFRLIGKPVIFENFPRASERNYEIYQCRSCKYYFVSPEIDLSQDEWKGLYENDYFAKSNITPWQKKLHDTERKNRLKLIQSKLKIEKGKFLDMGCGEGYVLQEAYSNGFEPYGVDIAYNLAPGNTNFNFFKGNIFEADFPDNYFSAIYMDSVLEHILKPMETLQELRRILKPGGVIFEIVPNEDSLNNDFVKLIYILTFQPEKYGKIKPFVLPYHIHGFNSTSLRTALSKSGFREIDIIGFGGDYAYWKAYKFGTRQYFQYIIMYPLGLLSTITNRQIQLMSLSVK
jgi:ubiquinone/menaquinone biosynthesis C-methylase UbiE